MSTLLTIELYANNGTRKNTFQTGVGDFSGCEFTLSESGSRDFTLYFSSYQEISKTDIVKIKLYSSANYFFAGVIRGVPIEGIHPAQYTYSGMGLADYITRLVVPTHTFSSDNIETILEYILDNVIVPSTPITKDMLKVNPANITIGTLNTNYTPLVNILDFLKQISSSADDYVYGVDADGDFFFDVRSTTVQATLVRGATGNLGIPDYNPENVGEPVSKIYLKDKDGVYISTHTNTDVIDIKEIDLTAPDIDNTSAGLWADGQLAKLSVQTRRASITWPIESSSPTLLTADGTIRIISNIPPTASDETDSIYGQDHYGHLKYGGPGYTGYDLDDTLDVKQVKYIINSNQAIRQIELGELPVDLNREIIDVYKKLNELKISLGV